MNERAAVKNAADVEQVRGAARRDKSDAERRRDLVEQQLSTPVGREFVWRELERHGIYDRIQGALEQVYLDLGQRNAGIDLMVEVMREHPEAYLLMHREAVERLTQRQRVLDAAHTTARTEQM